jgi:hypothetical protein
MRKLIVFDDETLAGLTLLSRNRMATLNLRRKSSPVFSRSMVCQ